MKRSKPEEQDNERWKENISKRIQRLETIIFIIAVHLVTSFSVKIWSFRETSSLPTSPVLHETKEATRSQEFHHDKSYKSLEEETITVMSKEIDTMEKSFVFPEEIPTRASSRQLMRNREANNLNSFIHPISFSHKLVQQSVENKNDEYSHRVSPRKLQMEDNLDSCNGTLFRLDLKLDGQAQFTSWELIHEQTNILAANQSYTKDDSYTSLSFTKCIEPGPYTFALNHNAFGINCDERRQCYNIFVDNDLIIQGRPFALQVVNSFNSSSLCMTNTEMLLQVPWDQNENDTKWHLLDSATNENIQLTPLFDDNGRFTNSYFSCLSAGYYSFDVGNLFQNGNACEKHNECSHIFMNDDLFFDESNFTGESTIDFYISDTGKAGYAQDPKCKDLPLLSPINIINNFQHDENIGHILNVLNALSSSVMLSNLESSQYKAACWLLYDDSLKIVAGNELLMERYAMAVLFFDNNQDDELSIQTNFCDYDRIGCNNEGHVTAIRWGTFLCHYCFNVTEYLRDKFEVTLTYFCHLPTSHISFAKICTFHIFIQISKVFKARFHQN